MKRVIVSLLALSTIGLGLAIPLQANAQSLNLNRGNGRLADIERGRHEDFKVLYRTRSGRVHSAGIYRDRRQAEREVRRLERDGYRAWVERV